MQYIGQDLLLHSVCPTKVDYFGDWYADRKIQCGFSYIGFIDNQSI